MAERTPAESEHRASPRILYLTTDPGLIRRQIAGVILQNVLPQGLLPNISTDAITPARYCANYTGKENLGDVLLVGIQNGAIQPGDIAGKFDVLVAGKSFGIGSSREHCQIALAQAGIRIVSAASSARIFKDNCTNYGIRCDEGEIQNLSPVSGEIFENGGLIPYLIKRKNKEVQTPKIETAPRPMTMIEKILAAHVVQNDGKVGVAAVKPGDEFFVKIDGGYAYEVQSIISKGVLEAQAPGQPFLNPQIFRFFEDHSALYFGNESAATQRQLQRQLAARIPGSNLYAIEEDGVEGICHTVMLEKHILPGQLILGNDSHTCTGGAGGAAAIGKGASDMAGALLTNEVLVTTPQSIRFNLTGTLPPNVTSKDLMLHILAMEEIREGYGEGKVFEYAGPALNEMPFDDQVVLTNMAVEGRAFTGIVHPNRQQSLFMIRQHGLSRSQVRKKFVRPDKNAVYARTFDIDLSTIQPMVAMPDDPQNGIPISQLGDIKVDIAYVGSCTGGKLKDLQEVAAVLKGKKVAPGVKLYVQASSQTVRKLAQAKGLIDIFESAGAEFLLPGCGACMDAGPGTSQEGQVTISDTNRNYKGRMGKGKTYLSSAVTVAQSAIEGKISAGK